MLAFAIVTAPEMIGLLAWWSVVLAAPVILLWRLRRRGMAWHVGRRWLGGRAGEASWAAKPRSAPRAPDPMTNAPDGEGVASNSGAFHHRSTGITASVSAGRPTIRSPHPSPVSRGLDAGTLEPLCRYVDFRRRLEVAASELEARLAELASARWRVEPYPLTGERRNTFLIVGETGIFVVSATYAPGHWDDVIAVSRLARKIQWLLPGYRGQVQPAICHPFAATIPRIWHRPDEHGEWVGAWLIGGDSVLRWLEHFGPEHGLIATDLARFDTLTRPNWLNGAIPAPRSWPPIQDAGLPDSRE